MSEQADHLPVPRTFGPRVRLARAARDAALAVPGVVDTDAGPSGVYLTETGGERFEGIVCAADPDGGYAVSVRLIAEMVPLPQLAELVSAAIIKAAGRVDVPCRCVEVRFADVVDPDGR